MNRLYTEVRLGAGDPFEILHISDTHLTEADLRDGERKVRLAEHRSGIFPEAKSVLEEAKGLAKERKLMIVHTGDLIDFVSEANLEAAKRFTSSCDCFTAAGNHEFSLYVGEAKEDAAYRAQSLGKVQKAFTNDIRFSSRVVNGVNFVAADNSYYRFEPWQLSALQKEAEKDLPIVLCLHTPLYEERLFEFLMKDEEKTSPAYLMSVPEEKMKNYAPDRYEQQKEDEITREAYEYIKAEKRIRLILAGHVHKSFSFPFGEIRQLGVGCTDGRLIRFL